MIIVLHVVLAIGGILYTSYLLFAPSKTKLRVSYGLLFATITSGTYLTVSMHAPLLQTCMMGLLYTSFIALGLAKAHAKLASVKVPTKR